VKPLAIVLAGIVLAACAPLSRDRLDRQVKAEIESVRSRAETHTTVAETGDPYIKALAVEYIEPRRGGLTLKLGQAALRDALHSVSKPRGFSVTFVAGARPSAPVSVEINNQPFAAAVREIALSAGYVAVIDERRQQILIAEEATYLFRLPPFLTERQSTSYSVQANPGFGNGTTGGSNGSPASFGSAQPASPSNGATGANTSVTGTAIRSADALIAALGAIVGGNVAQRVQVVPESALIAVRGNAMQLRRARDLMDAVIREGQQQIEVEAAFVEVSLTRQFQYGIDWQRVIPTPGAFGSGSSMQLQLVGANIVQQPSLKATVTGQSVSAVINALESQTTIRVIAQPSAITRNHADAVLYRGKQVPYLAEVNQQAVANVGTSSTAKVGFVPEGTSLALRASVVDSGHIDLRLAPQQIQGIEFRHFSLGQNAEVEAPVFPLSQAHLSLLVEPGKTYVIGGLSLDSDNDLDQGVPGLAQVPLIGRLLTPTTRTGERTQLVLLLTARLIPGPGSIDSMIGESL
jgi:type II secretory pathway component GspD/PulD (secretin)